MTGSNDDPRNSSSLVKSCEIVHIPLYRIRHRWTGGEYIHISDDI
jgi:hypothetical protein